METRKYAKCIIDVKETAPVSKDDSGKMYQPFESYSMYDNEETSIWCHPVVYFVAGGAYTTGKQMEIDLLPGERCADYRKDTETQKYTQGKTG